MSGRAAGTRAGGHRPGLVRQRVTPPGLMLALTFATGVVDAVGHLRLASRRTPGWERPALKGHRGEAPPSCSSSSER
jgi:hypothetical protein